MDEMISIQLTKEQIHLVLLGLRTAAVVSRQNGHNSRANSFSDLAEEVDRQVAEEEEIEAFDDPGENRTFLDD